LKHADSIAARRTEKLESYLEVLYALLQDDMRLTHGVNAIRNSDLRAELAAIAGRIDFEWLRRAVERADELVELARRNIQKSIALDALILGLRGA